MSSVDRLSQLPDDWARALNAGEEPLDMEELYSGVRRLYSASERSIFPAIDLLFRPFEATRLENVRAVVLGLDPYPTRRPDDLSRGIADGLAFSARGFRPPQALQTLLFSLLESGLIERAPRSADLEPWARGKGVLLLNTSLSVEVPQPGNFRAKHQEVYRPLIQKVFSVLSARGRGAEGSRVAFLLLGTDAKKFASYVTAPDVGQVIAAKHPSRTAWWPTPGEVNHPFAALNEFLGDRAINWRLP